MTRNIALNKNEKFYVLVYLNPDEREKDVYTHTQANTFSFLSISHTQYLRQNYLTLAFQDFLHTIKAHHNLINLSFSLHS